MFFWKAFNINNNKKGLQPVSKPAEQPLSGFKTVGERVPKSAKPALRDRHREMNEWMNEWMNDKFISLKYTYFYQWEQLNDVQSCIVTEWMYNCNVTGWMHRVVTQH